MVYDEYFDKLFKKMSVHRVALRHLSSVGGQILMKSMLGPLPGHNKSSFCVLKCILSELKEKKDKKPLLFPSGNIRLEKIPNELDDAGKGLCTKFNV